LFRINILNLLVSRLILKFSCNKLVSQSKHNNISINKKSFKKNIKEKSIWSINKIKIIQTNNIFLTNILMFCNNIYKSRNSILLLFIKFEDIRN